MQRDSIAGVAEIREVFNPVVNSFKAKSLDEFFVSEEKINLPQTRNGQFNPEFVLGIHNRIIKQIDIEIADAKNNNLIPKKINPDKLKTITVNYALDRVQAQDFLLLSDNQARALISRSVFELNNRQHINDILNGMWSVENPETPKLLSYKIECERLTDKWTKVSGYLVEKVVLENPEKHLTIQRDDDILRQSYKLSTTRQAELAVILTSDLQIKELSSLGESMQRAVAEQLVDYRLQHGMDVNVTAWKFESMKKAAMLDHELSRTIESKLDKRLTPSFDDHGTSDIEQNEAKTEGHKLVIHNLRNEVHEQMYNLNRGIVIKDNYSAGVNKTVKQVRSFQRQMDRQHLEEMEHQKIQQNKGMGMSM